MAEWEHSLNQFNRKTKMARAKTPKQIAAKIRSLKKQITKLERQKKKAASSRKKTRRKTTKRRKK